MLQNLAAPELGGVSGRTLDVDRLEGLPFQGQGVVLAVIVAVVHIAPFDTGDAERAVLAFATPGSAGNLARGRDEGTLHVFVETGVGGSWERVRRRSGR